jgi:hypothetical protein
MKEIDEIRNKVSNGELNINDAFWEVLDLVAVIESLPSDEIIIKLGKENCILHKTSDKLGFLILFDLNDLRQFCKKILNGSNRI